MRRLRSRQAWALLGFLALRPGEWTDRAALASAIWPDAEPGRARHNLRQVLRYIREGLPENERWLLVDSVGMRIDDSEIDLQCFPSEDDGGGEFLEGFQFAWSISARIEQGVEDAGEEETPPFPTPGSFSRMGSETRRSAVLGLVPAWIARGEYSEALEEIARLRQLPGYATDLDLGLCEAELLVASHRIGLARTALVRLAPQLAKTSNGQAARGKMVEALCHSRQHLFDLAAEASTAAYRLADGAKDFATAKKALHVAAYAHQTRGDSDRAKRALRKGLQLAEADRSGTWAPILRYLAVRQSATTGETRPAESTVDSVVQALQASEEPGVCAVYLGRLGRILEHFDDYSKAMRLYDNALDLLRGTECVREISEIHTYRGDLHRRLGDSPRSLAEHLEAVALRRPLHDPIALATSLRGAGMAAITLDHVHQALSYLEEAERLYEMAGEVAGAKSNAVPLARTLARIGRKSEAVQRFDGALRYLVDLPQSIRRLDVPEDLQAIELLQREFESMKSAGA